MAGESASTRRLLMIASGAVIVVVLAAVVAAVLVFSAGSSNTQVTTTGLNCTGPVFNPARWQAIHRDVTAGRAVTADDAQWLATAIDRLQRCGRVSGATAAAIRRLLGRPDKTYKAAHHGIVRPVRFEYQAGPVGETIVVRFDVTGHVSSIAISRPDLS